MYLKNFSTSIFLIMFFEINILIFEIYIFLLYFCIYIQFRRQTVDITLASGCGTTPGTIFLKPKAKQNFHQCRPTTYYYSPSDSDTARTAPAQPRSGLLSRLFRLRSRSGASDSDCVRDPQAPDKGGNTRQCTLPAVYDPHSIQEASQGMGTRCQVNHSELKRGSSKRDSEESFEFQERQSQEGI
jgi:hypothetical protein